MGFRDVSKEISEIASGYHFTKPPAVIEDLMVSLSRAVRAILEFLRELFQPSGGSLDSRGLSFLIQIFIYAIAVAAIAWLIYYLVKRAATTRAAAARATKGATQVEELLDADGWQRQAERLATTQDYKGACRAVYLSVLQSLHENGIAQFAPTKTNYEYAYSLAKHPQIRDEFKEIAETVELIWFGNKSATIDDYQQSKQLLSGISPEIQRIGLSAIEKNKSVKP